MPYHIEMRKLAFTAEYFKGLLPRPHLHTHLELVYLQEGKSEVVLDSKKYMLEAGDIFLAFPNQIHFYHDKERVKGYLLIFSPEIMREFRDVFQTKVPVKPIVRVENISLNVGETMKNIWERLKKQGAFDEIVSKGQLLSLLGEVFSQMELVEKPGDQEATKRILSYCIEHYTEPLTLENLAKELYLNKYYISHIFRERMNTCFKDFINQLRVEYACELLEKGSSITDIAYACGFSCVRTFNRAFSKYMNMTPRDYVRRERQENN